MNTLVFLPAIFQRTSTLRAEACQCLLRPKTAERSAISSGKFNTHFIINNLFNTDNTHSTFENKVFYAVS